MMSYGRSLAHQWDAEHGPVLSNLLGLEPGVFRIGQHIWNVDRLAFERVPDQRAASWRNRIILHQLLKLLGKTVAGDQVMNLTLTTEYECAISIAKARRRLDERVEHRLQIESRTADDLEHVGGGGLLLQRFGEIGCARADR
jgi:hypothetical protein